MEVKDRIQEKSAELFRRYGIKSITMDEIATQLGISKKTIYQYFADKEQLVDAVIDEDLRCTREDCELIAARAENAVHENILLLDGLLEDLKDLNPAILYDLQKFHPVVYQRFIDHKNTVIREMVEDNMKRGIKEGLFRPDMRIDILTKFRIESIYLTFSYDFLEGTSFGLGELHHELFIHFLFGISTPKGHDLIRHYLEERKQKQVVPAH